MSTPSTDENAFHAVPGEADYEAAVAEIIAQLTSGWRISEKPATLPQTEDWFPPSRPRRGCEDC
jgi:hypothetical protein